MSVYALFNTGARKVLIGRFEPGKDRLDTKHINMIDKQAIASAERSFCAITQIWKPKENLSISYEIEGGGDKVIGPSAGLAFALALLEELTDKSLFLAATGDISDGTKNARVLPVEFIPEKLTAAINALSGTKDAAIFYPYGNDGAVTEELRKDAREKDIKLRPVKTLSEAVEAIMQNTEQNDPAKKKNTGNWVDKVKRIKDKVIKIIEAIRISPILSLFFSVTFFFYLSGAISLQFIGYYALPEPIRPVAAIIYPWMDRPVELKPITPGQEDHPIFSQLRKRLEPALEAREWYFAAELSCKSRLLNEEYTYWIYFNEATLETAHGQTIKLSLGTCEGSGPTPEKAMDNAIEKVWQRLQYFMKESPNTITGGQK